MNNLELVMATASGWVGAVGIVGAYGLVSRRRLDPDSVRVQTINVVGAGLLAMSALSDGNWPSLASNVVWMYLGLHTLVKARHALASAVIERWRPMRPRRAEHEPAAKVTDLDRAASSDSNALAA